MPSVDARRYGHVGEQAAARKYDLQTNGLPLWADAEAVNGTRYSIKTAVHTTLGESEGVFRFRKEHMHRLSRHHQNGVILVLLPSESAESTRPLKIVKVPTSEVYEAVSGRWYPETGHYELPWSELVSCP